MERMEKIGRCVIIGASPDTDVDFLRHTVRAEDYVICADGGADFARRGHTDGSGCGGL